MRTRATFRLFGDSGALSAALVTQKLGIEPTRAIEARNRLGRPESVWFLTTRPQVHDEWKVASYTPAVVEIDRQLMARLLELSGDLQRAYVGGEDPQA